MLGIDIERAGPEMWDAVGEICNMVAGNSKTKSLGWEMVVCFQCPR
jgi:CheY-specific phosphatase CheX